MKVLCLAIVAIFLFSRQMETVYAEPLLDPTTLTGAPCDGIDVGSLLSGYIYHGSYTHYNGSGKDSNRAPVLWRTITMGDTASHITILSEYILDWDRANLTALNTFEGSYMETFLQNMHTAMFSGGRPSHFLQNNVMIRLYTHNEEGRELIGDHTYTNEGGATVNYPKTASGQYLYLPWGYIQNAGGGVWYNDVYLDAANNYDRDGSNEFWLNGPTGAIAASVATLRNGVAVDWWLRSPSSSDYRNMLTVKSNGAVGGIAANWQYGYRPAAQFDVGSVLFASPVGGTGADGTPSDANYAIPSTGTAYKLTVLSDALELNGLTLAGQAVAQNVQPELSVRSNGSITVACTPHGNADSMAYKIVDSNHDIVGYGLSNDPAAITLQPKDLGGSSLPEGQYTVYVWAQKNATVDSHEGSSPEYFTLNVDDTVPTVSIAPSGSSVDLSTTGIALTFSEAMDTTASGAITMSPDVITGTAAAYDSTAGSWSAGDTVLTIPVDALAQSTSYTLSLSGFKDLAGNAIASIPTYLFTTVADTTNPTVTGITPADSSADIAVGGNIEITFSEAMNSGAGAVSLDNSIGTLTGVWTNSATYTASYSSLAYSTQYTITFSGFKDVAGNALNPDPANSSFTTNAAPPPPGTAPTITTALPNAQVGTAYSQTITATGTTPITWSIDSGSLPAGLTLNSVTGIISGTPTTASQGIYSKFEYLERIYFDAMSESNKTMADTKIENEKYTMVNGYYVADLKEMPHKYEGE